MIEVQEHWKKAGEIAEFILTTLKDKISYEAFKKLGIWLGEFYTYHYKGEPKINFKFHKEKDCLSSGGCKLLSLEDGSEMIEINCYLEDCDKEDYDHMLRVTLLHEVTHALQYSLKLFMGDSSHKYSDCYMTQRDEIDAEMSTCYNLYKDEFESINKNKLESYYRQYVNVPKCVLKAVSRFVWNYLTTGVYNDNLRKPCTSGF